ncbi:unnamed protein product [Caenorhabditis brenneri]
MLIELVYVIAALIYTEKITSPSGYKNCSIFNTVFTVFMTSLMINPIIFECHSNMEESLFKQIFFSLSLHYASILFVLCTCPYVSYILWRMSKVPDYDGDEPYLVIYGGEGSITKRTEENSE